jgi:hypothetical protein
VNRFCAICFWSSVFFLIDGLLFYERFKRGQLEQEDKRGVCWSKRIREGARGRLGVRDERWQTEAAS